MNTHDTTRLGELLQQKLEVLAQLYALAKRMLELTNEGDAGAMISLLAAKQGVIDALMTVEKQLAPFRAQKPEDRVWPSPQERARVAEMSDKCDELLKAVMEVDRQGLELAQARQAKAKTQIDSAHQAASARNAYSSSIATSPRQIDVASQG